MESKKLFNEVFEEVDVDELAGKATKAQCKYWWEMTAGLTSCLGTGSTWCQLYQENCYNKK